MKQGDIPAVKAQSFYEKLWRLHTDWRTKGAESGISFIPLYYEKQY